MESPVNPTVIAVAARLACLQIGHDWRRRQAAAEELMYLQVER